MLDPLGQMRGELVAVLLHLVDGAAGDHGDAALLDLLAHMGAHVVVKTAQDVVAAIDQRDVGAIAGEDAGEFQRDIAAALHHHALRQVRQVKRLVGGDHVLDAGNLRAMIGAAAGGDQHVFRGDLLAVGKQQAVRVLEYGAALDHLRAGFLDIGGVGRLQPRDLLVLVRNQRRPVERGLRNGPAETCGVLDLLVDMRADHEQFLRHAAADHAGAAHPVLFGDHDLGAMAGGDAGGAHAARSATDDEEIDVEFGHVAPAQSRTGSPIRSACCASSSRCGIPR